MTDRTIPAAADLDDLTSHSLEFAPGMREIARELEKTSGGEVSLSSRAGRPAKGRPSKAEAADPRLVAEAPFPELVTTPAHLLGAFITGIDDTDILTRAHRFELDNGARKSVLERLEQRLFTLGSPLGGPDPPFERYESLDPQEVIGRVQRSAPEQAALVFAYEHYHERRKPIMDAAKDVCGEDLARRTVTETGPRASIEMLAEPFPGYDRLNVSTEGRPAVRAALAELDLTQLEKVRDYEQRTKRRTSMLSAIGTAIERFST